MALIMMLLSVTTRRFAINHCNSYRGFSFRNTFGALVTRACCRKHTEEYLNLTAPERAVALAGASERHVILRLRQTLVECHVV